MKDYDAIIIGAGLGGLSTATFLANSGKRILLLESHNVPGGYATSFLRGRFEFETALHELSGLGTENNQGPLWKILNNYKVYPKVEFLPIDEYFHSIFPGFEITVPIGRQNFENSLCEKFPQSKQSILKMSAVMFDFVEQTLKANRIGMKAVLERQSDFSTFLAYHDKSLSQVMDPIISDPLLKAVLCQIWGYFMLPPSTVAFQPYAMMMTAYILFGPAHIRGKSQALSQAFVERIIESGGEVWLSDGAKKILTSGNSVRGVVTASGTEVFSPYIICNANPLTTCLNLIGPDKVPGWYLDRLNTWTSGASSFNVYMGLDCPCEKLGFKAHENFVNISTNIENQYRLTRTIPEQPDGPSVTSYNTVDPHFSPPGTSVCVITMINYAEPWLNLSGPDYLYAKHHLADNLITLAEKAAPAIRDHIEVVEISTPLTNIRYTGNPGGSIIGFDENYQGTGNDHLPNRGPLEGLYFANAWVNIGGGFEMCMETGSHTGNTVLKDMSNNAKIPVADKIKNRLEKETLPGESYGNVLSLEEKALYTLHRGQIQLRVKDTINETDSTRTLRLEPIDGSLPYFRAGQYIVLYVNINGTHTCRPYSISSMPGKAFFDVTIRRMPDGFVSQYLFDHISRGDSIDASGPHGYFYHEPLIDTSDLVFLAGGAGITPFMSIIRQTVGNKSPFNIHLIYGSRTSNDIIFKEELSNIAGKNSNIKVDFVISEPTPDWKGLKGFLDAKLIHNLVGDTSGKTFYMCGPSQMYKLCGEALHSLGVTPRLIHKEVFGPSSNITLEPDWPGIPANRIFNIIEEKSGKSFPAMAGEPLLVAMEKAGLVVPAICRSGECTACRTRLIKGKVYTSRGINLRWIDQKFNYIHPCMSYPLGDLNIHL